MPPGQGPYQESGDLNLRSALENTNLPDICYSGKVLGSVHRQGITDWNRPQNPQVAQFELIDKTGKSSDELDGP